jgi:hypothetical protein
MRSIRCLGVLLGLVLMLASPLSLAAKPPKAAKAKAGAKLEAVGQPEFAETKMNSGGARLAIGPDKKLYALVRSTTITSPTSELDVYVLEGNKWVQLGQPRFAKDVAGGDLTVTPDGQILVACSKGVYRYETADKKFHMGLGTGRGYAGFSWGTDAEPHKWEKEMPSEFLTTVRSDSKNHLYLGTTFDGRAALLEYNKAMADMWTAEKPCGNCSERDVQVEFYPVGTPVPADGKSGTEYSPGKTSLEKRGVAYMGLAIDDKDQVYLAFDPEPAGVRWGFEVQRWDAGKNAFVPLGSFTGDDEGNPNGGYSDGKAEQLNLLVHGNDIMVAYKEDSGQKAERQWKASAMKWTGSTWTQVGPQGFSGQAIDDPTLAANSKGDVFVSYDLYEGSIGGATHPTVMKLNKAKNEWVPFAAIADAGASTHMIIGPDNVMYIAYRDTKSGKITVKKTKT